MPDNIDNLLTETRRFSPDEEFTASAVANADLYDQAKADRLEFWADQARDLVSWQKPFTEILDWSNPPFAKWFADSRLNVAYNCLDRHVEAGNGERVAIHWEGEPGDTRTLTYAELTAEVKKAANMLLGLGVRSGDRVVIYLPLIPEAIVSMLAAARIGAIHSVVFGGFSAESIHARIEDAGAKVVITADGGWRKGAVSALKPAVDEALSRSSEPRGRQASRRSSSSSAAATTSRGQEGRDLWWHDLMAEAEPGARGRGASTSEHPLFILYTSGTTGKPKGILHTSGGYLTGAAYTHKQRLRPPPRESDVYWSTADIGWITGHTYVVYGPLANGATQVDLRGHPRLARARPLVGSHREVQGQHLLRSPHRHPERFMKAGSSDSRIARDLSSLRLLGSVGEPINPEAWVWYRDVIGGGKHPDRRHVVADRDRLDHDLGPARPHDVEARLGAGAAARRHDRRRRRSRARPVGNGQGGLLVITEPWPSMLRGIWGDPDRFKRDVLGRSSRRRATTSPATAPGRTRTATSGCWAASTTS